MSQPKKRRAAAEPAAPFFQHYVFRGGRHYNNIVPPEKLFGGTSILNALNSEVRDYLINPLLYEISPHGYLPLRRFIRFCGVRNSSRETTILSFAKANELDVLLIKTPIGFEPQKHLRLLYAEAKSLNLPVLVVLKDVEMLFRHDPELGAQENYARTRNVLAFVDELTTISEGGWPVWTVLVTDHALDLDPRLNHYFQGTFFWSGILELQDLYDVVTRCRIFTHCLQRYVSDPSDGGEYPFDHDEHCIMDFVTNYTAHCTYHQINDYVRNVVCRWRWHVPASDIASLTLNDRRLVPKTSDFMDAIRQHQSIVPHVPFLINIKPFI